MGSKLAHAPAARAHARACGARARKHAHDRRDRMRASTMADSTRAQRPCARVTAARARVPRHACARARAREERARHTRRRTRMSARVHENADKARAGTRKVSWRCAYARHTAGRRRQASGRPAEHLTPPRVVGMFAEGKTW
eukprot:3770428-Pleurochrysis_carterae.AAC.1